MIQHVGAGWNEGNNRLLAPLARSAGFGQCLLFVYSISPGAFSFSIICNIFGHVVQMVCSDADKRKVVTDFEQLNSRYRWSACIGGIPKE